MTSLATLQTVDNNELELENLTDEELLNTLQKLEQEKELLAQQQLLREIEKLQKELRLHEKQKAERQIPPASTTFPGQETQDTRSNRDETMPEMIYELPIEELSERLEELKKQREDLSNKKLLDEIEALQDDIIRLQTETDVKETRMIAKDAVAVYALSPSEIEMRWDSSEFGKVESYTVFHKSATAADDEYQSILLDGDVTSCVIPGLNGNTAYQIKMEADGIDKSEIKTDVVEVTTFKPVTGFVLILANFKGFQLTALSELQETQIDAENLQTVFKGLNFEVKLEKNLTGSQMVNCIQNHRLKLDENGIDCFILVLAGYKYHGYFFGIDGGVLINKLLDGLKFDPTTDSNEARNKQRLVFIDSVKIKEDIIEELDNSYQPRNVRVRYTDPSKIEVSFRPPKLSENQVKHFVVNLTGQGKTKGKTLEAQHKKDSYSCEFARLDSNAEYKFEVHATYPDSRGESISGLVKPFNKDSNRPKLFGVELISQSQIYAFWKPVSHDSQDTIFYKIYLRATMESEEFTETSVSYPCHIFDNLKQNTLYNIKVTTIKANNINTEESEAAELSIFTPQDGTPIIMADTTTAYILGKPNFLIAIASGAFVSGSSPSFLRCFKNHLQNKYNRFDIASIIQDVRSELIYTSDRYDMLVLSSTLNRSIYLGGVPKQNRDDGPQHDQQPEEDILLTDTN